MTKDLPSRRHRRNVKYVCIKPMWGTGRYGIWVPGDSYPAADLAVSDDGKVLTLEVRHNGIGGRLAVKPEVSNVIQVEMSRE